MSVVAIQGFRGVPRSAGLVKPQMDTWELTPQVLKSLKVPPFQRPVRDNEKVKAAAAIMKENGGVIEGVITLGEYAGYTWIVDGQHRLRGFELSELPRAYADVRIMKFENMGEMAEEFVRLNSSIAVMTADDILRGLEQTNPAMMLIRRECSFVGYSHLRANGSSPILSMSMLLKGWCAAQRDIPHSRGKVGGGVQAIAKALTAEDAQNCVEFLRITWAAWGRDNQYSRLWGALNLTLAGWLWCHVVAATPAGTSRATRLTPEQFKRGLMALSAASDYCEWLVGRNLGERDRGPAYRRMKSLIIARLKEDGTKITLPSPEWERQS